MWFELLWRVVVTVSIVFVILRYIGNSSQQMGLLVDGVSLVDSGEWILRILFGLRWVAVPFEVLSSCSGSPWSELGNPTNDALMDEDLFHIVDRWLWTTGPPSHPVWERPRTCHFMSRFTDDHINLQNTRKYLLLFPGERESRVDFWCNRVRAWRAQWQAVHLHRPGFHHVQLGPRFVWWRR